MKTLLVTSFALMAASATPAIAQHHGHADHHSHQIVHAHNSPYAGMQSRPIKALSDEQIAGLREGKGMAMAMPAELNGYPGPLHVLELATQLSLSHEQIARTEQLFAEMRHQARTAGEEIIVAEQELDVLFRDKKADPDTVSSAVTKAALAQGKLRDVHLRYHLDMVDVLSAEQIAAYNKLRGY